MGYSLSVYLRERVAAFVAAGHSRRAAGRHFAVGNSSAIRLMHRVATSGSCDPDRQGRPPGTGKLAPCTAFLIRVVEARPDITMAELRDRLVEAHGVTAPACPPTGMPSSPGSSGPVRTERSTA